MLKSKHWIMGYFVLTIVMLAGIGMWTVKVDPFFHYHKPDTSTYFYSLNNQRSQNDGISKHFDYQGLITGTSMTENFKTSEAEDFWGHTFIKVPYAGGSYKEINDNLEVAISHNAELKIIIRGLDMGKFFDDKDAIADLGEYPTYLYDKNVFNDVKYLFNRDVVFTRVYPMVKSSLNLSSGAGISSFDAYSNWMGMHIFGVRALFPSGVELQEPTEQIELTQEERNTILGNVKQNITDLAAEHPDVEFYYFFTPYSAAWWKSLLDTGKLNRQIQAEKIVIEEILKYSNIKLFSFNCLTDITTDLNNYKDTMHYGGWINSLMLKYMYNHECLITSDNYKEYLDEEFYFYTTYDYAKFNEQEDYTNDYYAAALLNESISGIRPYKIDLNNDDNIKFSNSEISDERYNGNAAILCQGCLQRAMESGISVSDYLRDVDYVGFRVNLEDISLYRYLVFYGKKVSDQGQPGVYVYDETGDVVNEYVMNYQDLDNEWHQYLMDISQMKGKAVIIFNGGYTDYTGNPDSGYIFSNITLY